MSKDILPERCEDVFIIAVEMKGRCSKVTNAISVNVFGILIRLFKSFKSLQYLSSPHLPVTRVLLKLEDPDAIGNDTSPIIKLQGNSSNKKQSGKTEPIYLTFSPRFTLEDKMSAAQNTA